MNSIKIRIRAIRLIKFMERHPDFSKKLGLVDLSYYTQLIT